MSAPAPSPVRGNRPTPALAVAAALLALVGLVAGVYGVLEIAAINPNRPIVGLGTGILLIGYGVLLLLIGRGVLRGRRWSRGPAVATSLIQLPVAWSFGGGETWWVAIALGAVSVAVLVCLLIPSSTAVFVPDAGRADGP